jgi:tetratricopeptide (TPR) repeat protein
MVAGAVVATHWPALSARALSFDDHQYLTENVLVQNPGWASARRFGTEVLEPSTVRGYYQPLGMISLMLDSAMGGHPDDLRPFHRTSLALHVANTALVIVLLYLLFGRVWVAAGVGLLFGVHPMTVEPIPWVGERKTLLAAFFALWSLILYVRYAGKGGRRLYVGCLAAYVLALMSKPTATPLPLLMLLMDYWPLGRWRWRAVLEKLPLLVVGGLFAIITYVSQSHTASTIPPGEQGPWRIGLILCHNIVFYLHKMAWPADLSSHYAFPKPLGLSDATVLAGVIGTCILIPLLVVSLRWTRAALTGWLIFFVALLPTMQIVGFTNVIACDKFAYLPSVGLLMALASLLGWLCGAGGVMRSAGRRAAVMVVVLVVAGAEAVSTRRHLVHWRDTIGLCEYMLSLTPDTALVHDLLGNALYRRGEPGPAIDHYRASVRLNPNFAGAHNNLGVALQAEGRLDDAIGHYRRALQIKPRLADAHNNLGVVFQAEGDLDKAIGHYRQALQIKPDLADAHSNLGVALRTQGKSSEAIDHFRRALEVNPRFAKAHSNLGKTLAMTGEVEEALEHFEEAARLAPDWPTPMRDMAWILATHPDAVIRNESKAIRFAERAVALTRHRDAKALDTLAAAYASAGRFDRAAATAQEALSMAPGGRQAVLIRRRLELYRQSRPYREPVRAPDPDRPS